MKKGIVVGIAIGIIILGAVLFYFLNSDLKEQQTSCQAYDGDEQGCLLQEECRWVSGENICNPLNTGDEEEPNQELEAIDIPNTLSNQLCKQIPLSDGSSYGQRYQCLAAVNHDARFCEGIDEEKERYICLAYANKDSSYCNNVESLDAKKVCYYMLAVYSKNSSFCGDIDYNSNEKEQCYYNFISNLYQWGKSEEIKSEDCAQLGSPDDQTCLALKARDISMCGDNPNCLTHFEQPLSFCDEHPEISFSSCIKDRAKTSQNISICELLSQPDRDVCVGVYCTHTELNVNLCDTIEDINERESRYFELAVDLSNW